MFTDEITDNNGERVSVMGTSSRHPGEIIEAHIEHGGHFFDPDTMRFFGTRRNSLTMHGVYMVGKDSNAPAGCEPFWVRAFGADGGVYTFGKFFSRKGALSLVKILRAHPEL